MQTEDKSMGTCEAHEILLKEIDRVKNNQTDLYSLDRKRAETLSDMQSDIAEIKTDSQHMKQDITELKEKLETVEKNQVDMKEDQIEFKSDLKEIKTDMKELKENFKGTRWQPKDICVIIVAIISLLSSVLVCLLGR